MKAEYSIHTNKNFKNTQKQINRHSQKHKNTHKHITKETKIKTPDK